MATQPDNDGPNPAPPPSASRFVLQPGQLSKPEKVWASSSALIIGFYQAAPYSEAFKIFYKKSGAVFGTQVMLTPASILGPELAVRQPMTGEAQYFEYEIKKLKPSTQYVVKIKTSDDSYEVRSDKMVTISRDEERTRDNDMCNFKGALVKLGDYDGLVVSYAQSSGIFGIRILQIDDVASSLQLARLTSDYTDSGVPVQAYTLSQVRFGRWGGAITGSKVVNEGELKWLVARAVQMGDKSDAAAAFEARQRMLQAQVERVTLTLEVEWSNRFRNLRVRSLTSLALLALVAVAAVFGMWAMLGAAGWRQRDLEARLAANAVRQSELEAELQVLHLYRVSLELDVERRMALLDLGSGSGPGANGSRNGASGGSNISSIGEPRGGGGGAAATTGIYRTALLRNITVAAAAGDGGGGGGGGRRVAAAAAAAAAEGQQGRGGGGTGVGGRSHDRSGGRSREGRAAAHWPPAAPHRGGKGSSSSKGGGKGGSSSSSRRRAGSPEDRARRTGRTGGSSGGGGKSSSGGGRREEPGEAGMYDGGDAANLWGLPHRALRAALERSHLGRLPTGGRQVGDLAPEWLAAASGGHGGGAAAGLGGVPDPEDDEPQPDAWTFIHYVSNVYALHLQEWMKVQLQKSVRWRVNEMLLADRDKGEGDGGDGGGRSGRGGDAGDGGAEAENGGDEGDEEDLSGDTGHGDGYDDQYGEYNL